MERKYPWQVFILGLLMNFLIRNFLLFLGGLILCILGIWIKNCLYMGLAAWIFDLILSFIQQLDIRREVLSESGNVEYDELMDTVYNENPTVIAQEEQEWKERQAALEKLVVYRTLKSSIQEGMTLDELISAFEKMCEISVGDPDNLLFETGTYNFTGEKVFYFSLVRQFQFLDPDEYVQLRLEVQYEPGMKTALLRRTTWGSLTGDSFFDTVRSSRDYRTAKELPIIKVEVRVEET